jgi:putative glutamine amidotransferase
MSAAKLPRIAIPMPHSTDLEYAERSIPQYENAVRLAGGEPVRVALDLTNPDVAKIIASCHGVLLPGSKADVDPAKFGADRSAHTADADSLRESVDELMLEDAYLSHKPILGICYGLQSLNVYRKGSLIQHIPDFLPDQLRTLVDHEAGKTVAVAHTVELHPDSKLGNIPDLNGSKAKFGVNSSHHQSAGAVGAGLRTVGSCAEDGIVEALEGTDPDHFVLAVQWHPERSVDHDEPSRAIFRAFVEAARARRRQLKSST